MQTKKRYWHFDAWNKAGKALGVHFTTVRFSLRAPERLMVTSANGTVTVKEEKLVADEYLLITMELDVRWERNGHAYVMGVRNSKYDLKLASYA